MFLFFAVPVERAVELCAVVVRLAAVLVDDDLFALVRLAVRDAVLTVRVEDALLVALVLPLVVARLPDAEVREAVLFVPCACCFFIYEGSCGPAL